MNISAVVLAAGYGKRMQSKLPKVLHPLLGRPMAAYVLQAVQQATDQLPVMVIGHAADQVRRALGESARYVLQEPQLGTGHAVLQAKPVLEDAADLILVTTADMPLLRAETLHNLVLAQQSHAGPLTMLTVSMDDPHGFGRVLRAPDGRVLEIVEESQATPEQLAVRELNASVYCFQASWLWSALERVKPSSKGEYYLTDVVALAVADDLAVQAISAPDADEATGVNTRVHLAQAASLLRQRVNEEWMLAGVTIVDPVSTYIESDVQIGTDTTLLPNTHLMGKTVVGTDCVLGPNTIIRDCNIGKRVKVLASVLEDAVLEDDVDMGPFGHLRKGAHLGQGVHMGNFGEVKDSYLGAGTKMGHFSYIGNASIGTGVNIGAGTITCNFDGVRKNHTEIADGAFIGSDTMLVAPVRVGEGAITGAGSVVTKDVPDHTLAVGLPARAIRKLDKRD